MNNIHNNHVQRRSDIYKFHTTLGTLRRSHILSTIRAGTLVYCEALILFSMPVYNILYRF